jgi:translocator assembly and maintenance protein 41
MNPLPQARWLLRGLHHERGLQACLPFRRPYSVIGGSGAATAALASGDADEAAAPARTQQQQLPLLHPARVRRLLSHFPPAEYGFAYGSGAFEQPEVVDHAGSADGGSGGGARVGGSSGSKSGAPLLDLIFAVDDPRAWHAANLVANPKHYSGVSRGLLGPSGVDWVARRVGAAVHFNTLVTLGSGDQQQRHQAAFSDDSAPLRVKYGVIGTADLVEDLLTWRHLYVAGRLHKPVAPLTLAPPTGAAAPLLRQPHHHHSAAADQLDAALAANLRAALHTALLLSPETFTLRVSCCFCFVSRERARDRPIAN